MNGLNYVKDVAETPMSKTRAGNMESGRLRSIPDATQYRAGNSNDKNKINVLNYNIEKYGRQISTRVDDGNACMRELE